MPSRMIDYDNLWASDKLGACPEWAVLEYTWLYGLADANGSFELNFRSIWSRVSAIRPKLKISHLQRTFAEFERHGLLFTWTDASGKQYGHWTGSNRPGRLPPVKERYRYKKFAPPVPIEELSEYESRFNSRCESRPTSPPDSRSISPTGVGVGVGVGLDWNGVGDGHGDGGGLEGETQIQIEHESKPSGTQDGGASVPLIEKTENQSKKRQQEAFGRLGLKPIGQESFKNLVTSEIGRANGDLGPALKNIEDFCKRAQMEMPHEFRRKVEEARS
jgi:hypothetical protein